MTPRRLELSMRPLTIFLAACGTPPVEADIPWIDAGEPTVAAPDVRAEVEVAPPSRTCPAGWTEEALATGGHLCAPFAAVPSCDVTSAQFPGEAACAPIGDACPTGPWPDDVTDAWFVAAGGTGTGTREAPFGDLAAAVAVAQDGDTLVIGAGTFDTSAVVIERDVTIRGLCPTKTVLTRAEADPGDAILLPQGANLTLRGLRIAHSDAIGVDARGGALNLEGVVIDDVGAHGINALGTDVTVNELRISAIRPKSDDQTLGRGITMVRGSLTASRLQVDNSHQAGVWIEGDKKTPVTIEDFVVYGMTPQVSDNNRGAALRDYAPGDLTVRRAFVAGGNDYGIAAGIDGLSTLEDVWIQDVGNDLYDGVAFGAVGTQGSTLVVRGLVVRGAPSAGINMLAAERTLDVEDTYISSARGSGVSGQWIGDAHLSRVVVEEGFGFGVDLFGPYGAEVPSVFTLEDLRLVRNGWGLGLSVAQANVSALVAEDNAYAQVTGGFADLSITDASLRSPNAADGMGVVLESSTLALSRVRIAHTSVVGLSVAPSNAGTTLEDVIIEDVRPHPTDGYSLGINADGPLTLRRVSVSGAAGEGIAAFDADVVAEDLRISGVTADAAGRLGLGLDLDGSYADLSRVVIRDTQMGGLDCDACVVTVEDLAITNVAACPTCEGEANGVYIGPYGGATLNRVLVEGCATGLRSEGVIEVYDGLLRANDVAVDAEGGWYGGLGVVEVP